MSLWLAAGAASAASACANLDLDPDRASGGGAASGGELNASGGEGNPGGPGGASPTADACGVDGGDGSTCDCTDAFCRAIVREHNMIREAVNQGRYYEQPHAEPPIPMLVWDPLIAAKAQEYASSIDDFSQGHSSQQFRTYKSTYVDGYHGENMAIGGGAFADPASFVREGWGASEAQDCTLASCGGHYTQIVWRSTVAVGCAQKEGVAFGGNIGTLTVCQYGPGGNISGRDPY